MTTSPETLLRHAHEVERRVQILAARFLETSEVADLDYLSLYTATLSEYQEKRLAALALGKKVGEKNGDIFSLREVATAGLRTRLIRVCRPPEGPQRQLGCADVIPADFDSARDRLAAAGFDAVTKSLGGHEYAIVPVEAPDLQVSLYVPSMRITELMGLSPAD